MLPVVSVLPVDKIMFEAPVPLPRPEFKFKFPPAKSAVPAVTVLPAEIVKARPATVLAVVATSNFFAASLENCKFQLVSIDTLLFQPIIKLTACVVVLHIRIALSMLGSCHNAPFTALSARHRLIGYVSVAASQFNTCSFTNGAAVPIPNLLFATSQLRDEESINLPLVVANGILPETKFEPSFKMIPLRDDGVPYCKTNFLTDI